eukprot:5878885-Lingulodinium_polyedra.AAC.1
MLYQIECLWGVATGEAGHAFQHMGIDATGLVVDVAKVWSAFTDLPVEAYVLQAAGRRAQALQVFAEGG